MRGAASFNSSRQTSGWSGDAVGSAASTSPAFLQPASARKYHAKEQNSDIVDNSACPAAAWSRTAHSRSIRKLATLPSVFDCSRASSSATRVACALSPPPAPRTASRRAIRASIFVEHARGECENLHANGCIDATCRKFEAAATRRGLTRTNPVLCERAGTRGRDFAVCSLRKYEPGIIGALRVELRVSASTSVSRARWRRRLAQRRPPRPRRIAPFSCTRCVADVCAFAGVQPHLCRG